MPAIKIMVQTKEYKICSFGFFLIIWSNVFKGTKLLPEDHAQGLPVIDTHPLSDT